MFDYGDFYRKQKEYELDHEEDLETPPWERFAEILAILFGVLIVGTIGLCLWYCVAVFWK